MMIQAKGFDYKIEDFLCSSDWAQVFEQGLYLTYYLCPTDYHHIHAPVSGEVIQAHLIPGQLWPVNDWSVLHNKNLFARNERLVTYIQTERGVCALVMVGATVVGKMTVSYDPTLVSNRDRTPSMKAYSPGRKIKVGDRLGTFHMGSTVIMVYPKDFLKLKTNNPEGPIRLGQTLGS
jgi:phosphatidylserine decarboxylase